MNSKLLWLWALVLCVSLTACSKDEAPLIDIPSEFSSVKFNEENKTKTITFKANQSWTASIIESKAGDKSWLSVSPLSGGSGKVTLTISATESYSQSERKAYIQIQVDGQTKKISVSQEAGIVSIADDKATDLVAAKGFFVVNEDWFGHDDGTVNYFKKEGDNYIASYRAYRAANTTKSDWFGVTTTHATIWGDYVYFSSKQGNRFVVADAKSLKKKSIITNIGGDGRSFIGVDHTKGYIGHSSGIAVFDITKQQVNNQISGVSGEIGSMGRSNGRIFAISQSNGIYVINAQSDVVEKTIAGSYNTLTVSKDGNVWVAGSAKLIKLDPSTLEKEEFDYPNGAKIPSSWGAWNAGGLCASTQQNVLYWITGGGMFGGGKTVVKYDIDTKTANTSLYTLGKSEFGVQMEFYGSGMRVDPLTDELILTVVHGGWGDGTSYNWIHKLDSDGRLISNFNLKGGGVALDENYYWFPAVPFFEDANKPQILINQIVLAKAEEKIIDLDKIIVDYDNTFASIDKIVQLMDENVATVSLNDGKLTVKAGDLPGKTTCKIAVISNGVPVEKSVRIDIAE